MGLGTLNNRSAGQTIQDTFFNEIHAALNADFVGRNVTGVPTAGQNLGTVAVPWGTGRFTSLIVNGDSIDSSQITAPPNRVVTGKKRSTSNQPAFLVPNGSGLTATLLATATNLQLDVNGADVLVSADIALTGLTAAPGAANTALVNDVDAAGQEDTRLWGEPEHRKAITIDTVGANISALVGKYASFALNGEYFYAFVESATKLSKIRRGYYYNSSITPLNRTTFSNNDTITLLKTAWLFVENDGTTTDFSYNPPVWSFTSPGAPTTGDYWYDLLNRVWKRYDGAAFQIINRVLVGQFVSTSTATVGARCVDFFAAVKSDNTISVEKVSTEIVRGVKQGQKVSIMGMLHEFRDSLPSWNITTNLAASTEMYNAAEQASTMYYLYLADTGAFVISDISPYFREDLLGEYHPHNPWRCVGLAYNDSGSDIQGILSVAIPGDEHFAARTGAGAGAVDTVIPRFTNVDFNTAASPLYFDDANLGAYADIYWPGQYHFSASFIGNGSRYYGIRKNPANSPADRIATGGSGNSGHVTVMSGTVRALIGDRIQPDGESGGFTDTTDTVTFRGRRIA